MSKSTIGETIERLIKESKTDEDLRNKVGRLIRNDWNSNIRINNKIRQALSYRQIGKKPGIEIVGGRNHSKQDVFDAITQLLSDFYEERGSELETHYFVESLILVTKLFEHGKNRHFFPIYIPSESANVQHGYVEIEQRKQEQEDPEWMDVEFSHSPMIYNHQIFRIYFNIPDYDNRNEEQSLREKDIFIDHTGMKRYKKPKKND